MLKQVQHDKGKAKQRMRFRNKTWHKTAKERIAEWQSNKFSIWGSLKGRTPSI